MNRIVTLSLTAAFALTLTSSLASAGSYQDAMRQCGAEWRQSDARKKIQDDENADGRAAWNAFRAECTRRVGWENKRKPSSKAAPAADRTGSPSQPASPTSPAPSSPDKPGA